MASGVAQNLSSWMRAAKYFVEDLSPKNKAYEANGTSQVSALTNDNLNNLQSSRRPENVRHTGGRVRFGVGINRFLPFLGYHHLLMIICTVSVVLISLIMAGCSSTSPGLPNIFIVELEDKNRVNARVGLLGICLSTQTTGRMCSNNLRTLDQLLHLDDDQSQILSVASIIKDKTLFPWFLLIAAVFTMISFVLLATFPGWHEEADPRTGSDVEVKPFPSRPVSQSALALLFAATVLLFASALWQHAAAVTAGTMIEELADSGLRASVGVVAMALAWAAFAFSSVVTMALLVMILSIHLLDQLAYDE